MIQTILAQKQKEEDDRMNRLNQARGSMQEQNQNLPQLLPSPSHATSTHESFNQTSTFEQKQNQNQWTAPAGNDLEKLLSNLLKNQNIQNNEW